MIDEKLLRVLCCPASQQSLRSAKDAIVAKLNARIPSGDLTAQSGEKVRDVFDEGLIRQDGKVIYPVRKGVPVLLVCAGIEIGDDEPAETSEPEKEEETDSD